MEVVILRGLQASGTSTFGRERLPGHVVVSKDLLRNDRRKALRQRELIAEALGLQASRSAGERVPLVALADTARRLQRPGMEEGFDELSVVRAVGGRFAENGPRPTGAVRAAPQVVDAKARRSTALVGNGRRRRYRSAWQCRRPTRAFQRRLRRRDVLPRELPKAPEGDLARLLVDGPTDSSRCRLAGKQPSEFTDLVGDLPALQVPGLAELFRAGLAIPLASRGVPRLHEQDHAQGTSDVGASYQLVPHRRGASRHQNMLAHGE